jgi:hypothetical protein
MKVKILIKKNGKMVFIYHDALAALSQSTREQGIATLERVSNVEPGEGGWYAHMNGKVGEKVTLGPFLLHKDAIAAELRLLDKELFTYNKETSTCQCQNQLNNN